ncbi:F-box only protein 8-like [Rutidosis leptorrhynchoides]|uniref:F-box only protein 8-like n=1 Tax=Rutidosis leptorrhynchoides TaxID=125765 RepID=UPI003A991819
MSDHIPFEIQTEIIKNLPVKSLIRFRSVSKPWKSLIDSSEFIVNYHVNHSQLQHHLLVRLPIMLGTSQGLFSFCKNKVRSDGNKMMSVVIWNPTIEKSVSVVVPNVLQDHPFRTVVVFGVCPRTMDPMLVKITYIYSLEYDMSIRIPSQVEIFTLSSGAWRSSSNNMPRKSILLTRNQVNVDSFIYWLATDRIPRGDGYYLKNMILSFDMISEEFAEIYLPDSLAQLGDSKLFIRKLRTSLVMLEINREVEKREYCVWRMENGAPNSFEKLFIIKAPDASLIKKIDGVLGFRKTGKPIIEALYDTDERNALFVYDPDSEQINDIGIYGVGFPYLASSYVETLLLLNH